MLGTRLLDTPQTEELIKILPEWRGKKKPELLAPAREPDALKAAVENGADAIYLGLNRFNARRQARNFSSEELYDAVKYAHLRGAKIYLAANILLKETELSQAIEMIEESLRAGVDALILQDLGLVKLIGEMFKGVKLHASTQINCHNTQAARWLEEIGFKRVVLARETSIDEARKIKEESGIEIEIFGHGALCFSYSGQCLFSSLVGGRSGNRGLCAQPCRLPYKLAFKKGNTYVKRDLPYEYLLSTRDLWSLPVLPKIIDAEIDAIKLEGRLKSAEYVAIVTSVYRREIDRAAVDPLGYIPLKESIEQLEEAFSRGFSTAYLQGIRGNKMMSYMRPNNRGAFIGRVVFVDNYVRKVGIALRKAISKGDILEFWVSKGGRVTQKVEELYVDGTAVELATEGVRAEVIVEKKRHRICPGDRVHRVFNAILERKAKEAFLKQDGKKLSLHLKIFIRNKEPVEIYILAGGLELYHKSDVVPEVAKTKQLTLEDIHRQMEKLGGTAYELASLEIYLEKGLFISTKKLNQIRREMVDRLDESLLSLKSPRFEKIKKLSDVYSNLRVSRQKLTPVLTVKAGDSKIARAALFSGANIVYVRIPPFDGSGVEALHSSFSEFSELSKEARRRNVTLGVAVPNIVKDSEMGYYLSLLEKNREFFSTVLVDNLGMAAELMRRGFEVIADYHLNVFNSQTLRLLEKYPMRRATLSVELSLPEIKKLIEKSTLPVEVIVHGDVEVMSTEHCVLLALEEEWGKSGCSEGNLEESLEESKGRRFCRNGQPFLIDSKEYWFPVMVDAFCRAHIFNSRTLCALEYAERLYGIGINYFRLELLLLRKEGDVKKIVSAYQKMFTAILKRKNKGQPDFAKEICTQPFTGGHFKRGVL